MNPSANPAQPITLGEASTSGTSPEELRTEPRLLAHMHRLSEISEPLALVAVALQWMIIVLTIELWWILPPSLGVIRWVLYVVCVAVIATRQHAILILMHDAAHGRLCKNRARNDFVSDMFCSFPMGYSTEIFRHRHLKHHQNTNTDQDPDWVILHEYEEWRWPMDQIVAFKIFACDFLGLGAHKIFLFTMIFSPASKLFVKRKLRTSPAERLRLLAFCTAVVAVFSAYHLWLIFFMFWLVPFSTVFALILRMRTIAEHLVVESEHELNKTRHVESNFIELMIAAPLNVNYHLAHHLYPSVPFYHLPEMHRILMREEVFRRTAHLTPSYWGLRHGVWAEVTRMKAGKT